MPDDPGSNYAATSVGAPLRKVATGVAGLDIILDGGLPMGRTTVVCGGPGAGKTVLTMEFLFRGAEAGSPGVFLSFEESAEDLRANAASMGMDLGALEAAGMLRVVHAAVPHGAVRSGQFDIQGMLAILDGHTREIDAGFVVIDAIDVLMRVFGDPEKEREELYVFHDWLRQRGLTALLTVKAGPGPRQVYPFLDYMADCVLLLDQRMHEQVRTRRLKVVKYRGSRFLGNEHPFVLSGDGMVLLPLAVATLDREADGEHVSSGSEAFDRRLGGGYLRGSCIVLAGPAGVGKTTLACLFAQAACRRGEKVLYVGLEEAAPTVVRGMAGVGIDLAGHVDDKTLEFLTTIPESRGIEEHLVEILRRIETFEPRHLIVDAISACERMGSRGAAFDFCVRLLTACRQQGITCLYINQVGEAADILRITGMNISSLVDTLVAMSYQDDGTRLSRRLLVVKSRGAKHSMAYHPYAVTDRGIEFLDAAEGDQAPTGKGGRP